MADKNKIVRLSALSAGEQSSDIEHVAMCFGQFNVIHPGHLRYLKLARSHGSKLVVAVEGDVNLSTGHQSVSFPEMARAEALEALELVDQIVILDSGKLDDLVRIIRPAALVLGKEYESEDLDIERKRKIASALTVLGEYGGEIFYEAGQIHYASGDIFRATQHDLEVERWKQFKAAVDHQGIDLKNLFERLKVAQNRKLLVLGDTIVDSYIACDPIGMSNEAPVVVVKELESKDFLGGAAIVAAHVAALGAHCEFISVVGIDDEANLVRSKLIEADVCANLAEDNSRPTTFKIRYLVENQKLFRVSRLNEHSLSKKIEDKLIDKIYDLAPSLDGILVSDFVYGVVTPKVIQALKESAKRYNLPLFGDVQCSSQLGDVSKFTNFTLISPTEREARVALNNQDDGVEHVVNLLMEKTLASNCVMKLGAAGFIVYGRENSDGSRMREHFPALNANPIDVTGAGDSMLAAMSVALTCKLTIMEAAALACCMCALAVETVGNLPITYAKLREYIKSKGVHV